MYLNKYARIAWTHARFARQPLLKKYSCKEKREKRVLWGDTFKGPGAFAKLPTRTFNSIAFSQNRSRVFLSVRLLFLLKKSRARAREKHSREIHMWAFRWQFRVGKLVRVVFRVSHRLTISQGNSERKIRSRARARLQTSCTYTHACSFTRVPLLPKRPHRRKYLP